MRTRLMNTIAMEVISFQDGNFHRLMTEKIETIRAQDKSGKDLFESPAVKDLLLTIKRTMRLTIVMRPASIWDGPNLVPPKADENHIFMKHLRVPGRMMPGGEYRTEKTKDIHALMDLLDEKIIEGTVDIKAARVSGAWEQMTSYLYMPATLFEKDSFWTAGEAAAVLIHELGHVFGYMEFVGRSVTTNQVLAALTHSLAPDFPITDRVAIFKKAGDLQQMDRQELDALMDCKDVAGGTVVLLRSAYQRSISELGASVYDAVGNEQLADQFASRMGAGRDLVVALDKAERHGRWKKRTAGYYLMSAMATVLGLAALSVMTVCTLGVWPLLYFKSEVDRNTKVTTFYDTPYSRFLRIKHDCVERLKNRDMDPVMKAATLADIETIDAVIDLQKQNLGILDSLRYHFNANFRKAHDTEQMQKDLEKLAFSDLFTHAAKFSTLT